MNNTKTSLLKNDKTNSFKNPVFIILSFLLFGAILITYWNHFSNDFQFDDSHTIVDNYSIREVNVAKFFTDGKTNSSLPANQSYRPMVTLENAIDYKIDGKLNSKVFHTHIFINFIILLILICVFVKKILDKVKFSDFNPFWALLVSAIFGLLCANAETINYIIQRAEIDSALFVLAGMVAFLHGGIWRSKYLYLVFVLLGFFSKEMAFVFAPLLFVYVAMFEENTDLLHFYKKLEFKKCVNALIKTMPAFLLTLVYYIFYTKMTPESFTPGGISKFQYLITQPFVICHYLVTFFVPYQLSADTDWQVVKSIVDLKVLVGLVVVFGLFYVALKTSKNKDNKLFSFGLLWFFISLLPTSSFIAFAEVLNDHRCFIPYIGLTISFVFGTKYLLDKYFNSALTQKMGQIALSIMLVIFLGANAYGVRQRNKVWHDDVSLWKDVAEKSPNNGRGQMNYGLALMRVGDYVNSEIAYTKAMTLTPNYASVYVNMGILKQVTGDKVAAESYFQKALACNNNAHVANYFYGRLLASEQRYAEATDLLNRSIALSPNYYSSQLLLMEIYHNTNQFDKLKELAESILKTTPDDAEATKYLGYANNQQSIEMLLEADIQAAPSADKYLNLSLKYYQKNDFEKCIEAASNALKLKPDYAEAYNNIGISWYSLKNYDKSIEAYHQALAINPDNQLAKNNLANAEKAKLDDVDLEEDVKKAPTAEKYLALSVKYFQSNEFEKCIDAAKKAIKLKPEYSEAYNNIGIAYSNMKQYDKAIQAFAKALAINPNNQFAKNNMASAIAENKK